MEVLMVRALFGGSQPSSATASLERRLGSSAAGDATEGLVATTLSASTSRERKEAGGVVDDHAVASFEDLAESSHGREEPLEEAGEDMLQRKAAKIRVSTDGGATAGVASGTQQAQQQEEGQDRASGSQVSS